MLRIHSVIVDTVRLTAPLAESIARRDRDLASQYPRALSSVALNVAEGSNQRGKRRESHYSIALGSAEEAFFALTVAEAWGYVGAPRRQAARLMGWVRVALAMGVTRRGQGVASGECRPPERRESPGVLAE